MSLENSHPNYICIFDLLSNANDKKNLEMERKKTEYMTLINDRMHTEGTEVLSIHWLSKREKINNIWTTTMSRDIRIEFAGKTPEKIYMDRISYTVREYTEEVVQCYNCQNYGHTSKWCRSQPVCVFCGVKGHRVKENKCNTDRARCHN